MVTGKGEWIQRMIFNRDVLPQICPLDATEWKEYEKEEVITVHSLGGCGMGIIPLTARTRTL